MSTSFFLSYLHQWVEDFKDKMLPETDPYYQTVKVTVFHLAESNKDIPQISEVNWTVHVVEDPDMNAFALPVGKNGKVKLCFYSCS